MFATVLAAGVTGVLAVRRARQQDVEATAARQRALAIKAAPEWEQLGFGEPARRHFLLNCTGFTHLNHGSYGVTPRVVLEEAIGVLKEVEAFPDDFFRAKAWPRYKQLCEVVGGYVGAPGRDVVLVPNATTAVNAVLYSAANIRAGDAVLITDITYNALQIAVREHCRAVGARVVVVPVPVGVPGATTTLERFHTGVLAALASALDSDRGIKWALLDHIR
jgi:histidinol-phosphate/aromatic aminotransferase/cobyric acid decarboxylase-like protein